jgi:hypothetical protein
MEMGSNKGCIAWSFGGHGVSDFDPEQILSALQWHGRDLKTRHSLGPFLLFFSVIWASFFAVDSNSDTPLLRYVGKNTLLHFDFDLT